MSEKAGTGSDVGVDKHLERLPGDIQDRMKRLWHAEEWEQLSREERRRLAGWILDLIESDVRQALRAQSFGLHGEEHTSRTISQVDERGWREINRIQDDALLAILDVKAESAERLAEAGEAGMVVLSAMLSCELIERTAGLD